MNKYLRIRIDFNGGKGKDSLIESPFDDEI